METLGIGKLIGPDERVDRDAIHVAVAPVVANEDLEPGQGITLIDTTLYCVEASDEPIGIVDPFLKETVRSGQRFFMFLNPYTITSLKHTWTHPAFAPQELIHYLREKKKREAAGG